MTLSPEEIRMIIAEVESVDYGRVVIVCAGDSRVDVVTERRLRLRNGSRDAPRPTSAFSSSGRTFPSTGKAFARRG